jgi:hypothetical protein
VDDIAIARMAAGLNLPAILAGNATAQAEAHPGEAPVVHILGAAEVKKHLRFELLAGSA